MRTLLALLLSVHCASAALIQWSTFPQAAAGSLQSTDLITGVLAGTNKNASLSAIGAYYNQTNRAYVRGTAYTTLALAKAAAVSNDTIFVTRGLYTTNNANLLKKGVNWHFAAGALVAVTNSGRDDGRGIFDDRDVVGGYQGAISGRGKFFFTTGLGGYTNGVFTTGGTWIEGIPSLTPTNIGNILGAVGTTNSATDLSIECESIGQTTLGALNATNGALCIKDALRVSITCDRIYDPYYGASISYGPGEFGDELAGPRSNGIYWELGELFVHCKVLDNIAGYGIWTAEPGSTNHEVSFWYEGDKFFNNAYVTGHSATYRTWIKVKEWNDGGEGANPIGLYGCALYVDAQKIGTTGTKAVVLCATNTTTSTKLWLRADKVTTGGTFAQMFSGTADFNVQEWNDYGTATVGFYNHGGTMRIHGGHGYLTNGLAVDHRGGTTIVENLEMNTANTASTNNAFAFVRGAPTTAASPSGLILRNSTLIVPAIAYVINATNAQAVRVMTTAANTNSSANITFTVGTVTVHGTVQ